MFSKAEWDQDSSTRALLVKKLEKLKGLAKCLGGKGDCGNFDEMMEMDADTEIPYAVVDPQADARTQQGLKAYNAGLCQSQARRKARQHGKFANTITATVGLTVASLFMPALAGEVGTLAMGAVDAYYGFESGKDAVQACHNQLEQFHTIVQNEAKSSTAFCPKKSDPAKANALFSLKTCATSIASAVPAVIAPLAALGKGVKIARGLAEDANLAKGATQDLKAVGRVEQTAAKDAKAGARVEQTAKDAEKVPAKAAAATDRGLAYVPDTKIDYAALPGARNMSDADRIAGAEKAIGRPMNDAEKAALVKAHYEGPGEGFGHYKKDTIKKKIADLSDKDKEVNFSPAERKILLQQAWAGQEFKYTKTYLESALSKVPPDSQVMVASQQTQRMPFFEIGADGKYKQTTLDITYYGKHEIISANKVSVVEKDGIVSAQMNGRDLTLSNAKSGQFEGQIFKAGPPSNIATASGQKSPAELKKIMDEIQSIPSGSRITLHSQFGRHYRAKEEGASEINEAKAQILSENKRMDSDERDALVAAKTKEIMDRRMNAMKNDPGDTFNYVGMSSDGKVIVDIPVIGPYGAPTDQRALRAYSVDSIYSIHYSGPTVQSLIR